MSKSTPTTIRHGGRASLFPDRLPEKFTLDDDNKPDFRELDLGSPVSPLPTRPSRLSLSPSLTPSTTTNSSSSSSESAPKSSAGIRAAESASHSGELSGSSESNPKKPTAKCRTNYKSTAPRVNAVNSPPSLNFLPAGSIYPSGKILKTGMNVTTKPSARRDVLGTGTGHYGHGSIMRGSTSSVVVTGNAASVKCGMSGGGDYGIRKGMESRDWEEVKRIGNEMCKNGNFADALRLYDRAIILWPKNVSCRCDRAAALSGLGRLMEAVGECEVAVKLDPGYLIAYQRLGSLFIRLGMVEMARKHLSFPGQQVDPVELQKLQEVKRHLKKCTDARRACDWKRALRECDAAVAAGAGSSPQLCAYRAESLLKLRRLEDADACLSNSPIFDLCTISVWQSMSFGMLSEAYLQFVKAQIELSLGRFDSAITSAEKARQIDPNNAEVVQLLNNVKLVARARIRGNDLFKSERFTEACSAYGEGLRLDPLNSVLYCNRAACWFKIGQLERSIEDCDQALRFKPGYTKALLRRAVCHFKLEQWSHAVEDYSVLRKIVPDDKEVAQSLFHAQVALRNSRGEKVYNMKFGGEVEEVSGAEQFRAAISSPGVSMVYFKTNSSQECQEISSFVDKLCPRYPLVSFIKVDIEENRVVADLENVQIVPTFKIYKNSSQVKEIICPMHQVLECTIRHYSC